MEFRANKTERLDQFLSNSLQSSRNQVANLIKNSNVWVNDVAISKPSFKLNYDDSVRVILPEIMSENQDSEIDFDVEILYEDDDFLVINKPSGVTTHPAPSVKEATIVEWLKSKNYTLSTLNGEVRAGIVHRLDKGTSGAMVVAKTNVAHANLSKQLSDKTMGRIYLALINHPLKERCMVDKAIKRSPKNRLKNAVIQGGKEAKSAFLNIFEDGDVNLIAAKLFTGRTHQIRVHLSSLNRHILGDNLYGFKSENVKISRVMLHAYLLYFKHPVSDKIVMLKAELPDSFKSLINKTNSKEQIYESILQNTLSHSFDDCDQWMCYK